MLAASLMARGQIPIIQRSEPVSECKLRIMLTKLLPGQAHTLLVQFSCSRGPHEYSIVNQGLDDPWGMDVGFAIQMIFVFN